MDSFQYFSSGVYSQKLPEFISPMRLAAEQNMVRNGLDDLYPVYMSGNISHPEFAQTVAQAAWNALSQQGYDMSSIETFVNEMWMQEHYKHSAMEQHIHPNASIVGFYFLECPEGSSKAVLHDPRPGKAMMDIKEADSSQVTLASSMINFTPEPGLLLLTNGWLPHSFTRHGNDAPFRFIHINIYLRPAQQCEVI
jgi:uncharacterized protein (TIGR02466 family)